MKKKSKNIYLLKAEKRKKRERTVNVPETASALFLLSGILFAFQDMMCTNACLYGAALAGCLVVLALQTSELFPRAAWIVRAGIYAAGIFCFCSFILYIAQGFLDTVNRFIVLWNLRFGTEGRQFSVNSGAVLGSLIFWSLLSAPLSAFLLNRVKRKSEGILLTLVIGALFAGFILGRSQMWLSVLFLLGGIFGSLVCSAAPGRQSGIRGVFCVLFAGVLFLGGVLSTAGYDGLSQITRLRAGAVSWYERFRYGEDTLPKGELGNAPGLLDGENETLKIDMEKPQEWYLRGFVGSTYDGTSWKDLSPEAYQGKYEGLLEWLATKDFSAVTQFSSYNGLTEAADGLAPDNVQVKVENTGAYRKYVYLPSSVERWDSIGSKEKKDWQVRSGGLFGAREYEFYAVDEAPSADGVSPAAWMRSPSGEKEQTYLDAETVYHSFANDYYTEVDADLKLYLEEYFFAEEEEMDFQDVTAQIRKALRQKTSYTETPQTAPDGQNFVRWFLDDSKSGNAVHYASAAVLAYRTAGYAARYVEGYRYSEEEAYNLLEAGETTAVLTNKNAHAWAEVYFSGVGWLPVEVVPGMYTELYTNQVLEGAPSYQVNSDLSEDGLELEGGVSGEKEQEEAPERKPLSLRRGFSICLIGMYICFFCYLLLELQRGIRRAVRRYIAKKNGGEILIEEYMGEMERFLLIGKVAGNYNHPLELSGEIEEKLSGVSCNEYERAVALLQKVRFGGKRLMPYEIHTLNCFAEKVLRTLYRREGIGGKIKLRYWYAD